MFYSTENCPYICFSLFFQSSLATHLCLSISHSIPQLPNSPERPTIKRYTLSFHGSAAAPLLSRLNRKSFSSVVPNCTQLPHLTHGYRTNTTIFIPSILYTGPMMISSGHRVLYSIAGQYKLSTARQANRNRNSPLAAAAAVCLSHPPGESVRP